MKIEIMVNSIFENPLINITIFGGLIFIIFGFILFRFPPKKINSLYGYRTASSMRNHERWKFAQNYSSKEMMKLGFLLSISSVVGFVTNFENLTNMFIGLGFMILTAILLILRVEKALKNRFAEK